MGLRWPEKSYLVDSEREFLFCPIPKVACSHLLRWCLEVSGESARASGHTIHAYVRRYRSLAAASRRTVRAALGDTNYFRFAFVRHPFSRLVAAYVDTFLEVHPTLWPLVRSIQMHATRQPSRFRNWFRWRQDRADEEITRADAERSVTFRQFVNYLASQPTRRFDLAWRPQCDFLRSHEFDFIGRFERLGGDFSFVQSRLQIRRGLLAEHVTSPSSVGRALLTATPADLADCPASELRGMASIPAWPLFFDAQLQEMAGRIYAADFEMFGYERGWDGFEGEGCETTFDPRTAPLKFPASVPMPVSAPRRAA